MQGRPFDELLQAYNAHNDEKRSEKATRKIPANEDDRLTLIMFNHEVASNRTFKNPDAPRDIRFVGGGTNFQPALSAVQSVLQKPDVANCEIQTLIFMSDGQAWDKSKVKLEITELCAANPKLRVQTVAFGPADVDTLFNMATLAGGSFHTAQVGKTELEETFKYISGESTVLSATVMVGVAGAAIAAHWYRLKAGPLLFLQSFAVMYLQSVGVGVGLHGLQLQVAPPGWKDDNADGIIDAPKGFASNAADLFAARVIVILLALSMGLKWSSYFYSKVTLLSIKLTTLASYPICYFFVVLLGPLIAGVTNYCLPFQGGVALATGTYWMQDHSGLNSVDEVFTKEAARWAANPFTKAFFEDLDTNFSGTSKCTMGKDPGCIPEWTLPLLVVYLGFQLYKIPLRATGIWGKNSLSAAELIASPWRHMLRIGAVYSATPWL